MQLSLLFTQGKHILPLRERFATFLAKNLNYNPPIDNDTVAKKPQTPIVSLRQNLDAFTLVVHSRHYFI
jgi:hypothetical protein